MPVYQYKCPEGHISESHHYMSDFDKPVINPAEDPRLNQCHCGEVARQVFLTVPFTSIDLIDCGYRKDGETSGFNYGAGRYFSNKYEKQEWMKRRTTVERDFFTGQEREVTTQEMCPEDAWREEKYLQEVREAKADKAPTPVHPDVPRQKAIVEEKIQARVKENRERALKTIGELQVTGQMA